MKNSSNNSGATPVSACSMDLQHSQPQRIHPEVEVVTPLVISRDNSIKKSASAKSAYLLGCTIRNLRHHYHESQLFFMTLTFGSSKPRKSRPLGSKPRRKKDWQSKAWNSLQTNVLRKKGIEWIRVMERNAERQKHFHIILVLPWKTVGEVRAGVEARTREKQENVDPYYQGQLLELSTELGRKLPKYGFGRWNMTPIDSLDAVANYVSKQITSCRQYYIKNDRAFGCSKELRTTVKII